MGNGLLPLSRCGPALAGYMLHAAGAMAFTTTR
ncbi:MAG: hypothetical protein V7634_4868 [Bradyrhizobium sp.]|jgi:hypothetical protein